MVVCRSGVSDRVSQAALPRLQVLAAHLTRQKPRTKFALAHSLGCKVIKQLGMNRLRRTPESLRGDGELSRFATVRVAQGSRVAPRDS